MDPGRTGATAYGDLAFEHEDHVGREVAVPAHHHLGVVPGVERQILRSGEKASHFSHTCVAAPSVFPLGLDGLQGMSGSSRWRKPGSGLVFPGG